MPLPFLIFIEHIEEIMLSQINFFAHDRSLYSVVSDPNKTASELNQGIELTNEGFNIKQL